MENVEVSNSPSATGLVMYDTSGTNYITNCTFKNNSVFDNSTSLYGGGGGLYIEFTYCKPGSVDCNDTDDSQTISGSEYHLTTCRFESNKANDSGNPQANYIVPYKSNHMALGRGGGLSIFVNGRSHDNMFDVISCTFTDNQAAWGAGMFVEFHDSTYNNTVSVQRSTFDGNKCNYTQDFGTAGGGMRIGFYVYDYVNGTGNRVSINNSDFHDNGALNGGGISISAALQEMSEGRLSAMTVNDVLFYNNIGRLGSALHIDGFPLILAGQMLTVHVTNCQFLGNSVDYLTPLQLQDDIAYQPGEGTVYIHNVPVVFGQHMSFVWNSGSGLAIVRAKANFSDTQAEFVGNTGNNGGGIALLGAAYIVINDNTSMTFTRNTAAITGGAIYNKYITSRTMGSYADCFIRYVDPLYHAEDWKANFTFQFNRDLGGSNDNAIHSTSILPCSWAAKSMSKIFCWKGWTFINEDGNVTEDCSKFISSDIGGIELGQTRNHFHAFPGQPFNLHLTVKDDQGGNLPEPTAFLASTNISGSALGLNGNRYSYIWGTNTTVYGDGKDSSHIALQLNTIVDRVWRLKLFVHLQPCPPGFTQTTQENKTCSCSGDYGGALICDRTHYTASLMNGYWMGHIEHSADNATYYAAQCPPGFCYEDTNNYNFVLPNNSTALEDLICRSKHRQDTLCGRCVEGHGPAVNSRTYECVNCTDPVRGALKYIAAVYIPLIVLFLVIIIFDIRLTVGAANAFILYAQIISSTFGVDADGHIPLYLIAHKHTNALLKAYRIPYGIFNLEFIENLLPPICVGAELNTLTVISLDYAVALTPLLMIVIGAILFRLASIVSDHSCKRNPQKTFKCLSILAKGKRSLSEAMLPACSAFLLLSYTKLALTPSYILTPTKVLDSGGNYRNDLKSAYFAGHLPVSDHGYKLYYKLPACVILAVFVAIPPLLLLDYPLRLFELGLRKVSCLWSHYPVGKVHHFLDTFQGCFKNNCRFFAGLYFLFRLVIHLNYAFSTWREQYVIQGIACVVMMAMLSLFQPYNERNNTFNKVDVLIFTNLAIINGLSFYLFEFAIQPPVSVFIIQYILIFLPLIFIITYIVWVKTEPYHKRLPCRKLRKPINYDVLEQSCDTLPPDAPLEGDDLILQRAELMNRYKPPNRALPTAAIHDGTIKRQTGASSDSGRRSFVSGSSDYYGTIQSTEKQSSNYGSTHSTISLSDNVLYQSESDDDIIDKEQ